MSTNLSVFPEQIDTFIRHSDVGYADLANVERYQQLITKDTLTSAETEELSRLFSMLRSKIWTAEDLNKIQDCMTNLETFFKNQSETYIDNLFEQYDNRMAAFDVRVDEMRVDVDNKIAEADAKIVETEATRINFIASVNDSNYFNFDNLNYRAGFYRKTVKTDSVTTVENIINASDNSVYASRTTIKNGSGDFTIITVCDMVEPKINTSVHTYKDKEGNWIEEITNMAVSPEPDDNTNTEQPDGSTTENDNEATDNTEGIDGTVSGEEGTE